MLSYTHFTHDERISLHNFVKEGLGIREIARRLGRDPSTICREDSNAEPHKPWQRGTNENTNGLLRFFFPKGYDFRSLSQAQLDVVVDLLNDRPRKCLGWKTPREVFVALA